MQNIASLMLDSQKIYILVDHRERERERERLFNETSGRMLNITTCSDV